MPLPLIIGVGIGVGTAVTGLYNLFTGKGKLKKAKTTVENAKAWHKRKINELNRAKNKTNNFAQDYANLIIKIRSTSYEKIIQILDKIGQKNKKKYISLLDELKISPVDVDGYKTQFIQAKDIASGTFATVAGGVAASQAALGAVGLFGVASTGTAIGSLSGVAASNAILAWLGGGSLAAGGGGMAMGSVVLGGFAVGPALLISGLILSSKGEKALTEATKYESNVELAIKKIDIAIDILSQINNRIIELKNIILNLSNKLDVFITKLNITSFNENKKEDMQLLKSSILFLKSISEVSSTPVVDSDGKVSEVSQTVIFKYKDME